jgi:hypothetical protein
MTVEIEGTRSSDAAWREADNLSLEKLRELTAQDIAWPTPDDPASEQLARRLYANDRTQPELVTKCLKLSRLASDWLKRADLKAEVVLVRLRCVRGLFDLHVDKGGEIHKIELREDVFDDLLQSGSREALESLDRLFAVNLGRFPVSKAS